MENKIEIFNHDQFGQVRVINNNGMPLFVANDIATLLGYTNPQKAIRDHCKGVNELDTPTNGGMQKAKFIAESDVYRLVMRSKLPQAEQFQDWVCEEVLPSIRKHGMYATDITIEKMLNDPDYAIALLTTLKEERALRIQAQERNAILMHVNKTYTATEVAKELGLSSANKLNEILKEKGIQYKQNDTWIPYSKYSCLGYFDIKQDVLDNGKVIYHRRITQIGRDFIINLVR